MFLWCVRDGWRDIYSERNFFPCLLPGAGGYQCLHPFVSSSETLLIGCMSLAQLRFSALCLKQTVWFSSHGHLPVTHLLYLTALIVLSCLLITTWQLVKAHSHQERTKNLCDMLYNIWPSQLGLQNTLIASLQRGKTLPTSVLVWH